MSKILYEIPVHLFPRRCPDPLDKLRKMSHGSKLWSAVHQGVAVLQGKLNLSITNLADTYPVPCRKSAAIDPSVWNGMSRISYVQARFSFYDP